MFLGILRTPRWPLPCRFQFPRVSGQLGSFSYSRDNPENGQSYNPKQKILFRGCAPGTAARFTPRTIPQNLAPYPLPLHKAKRYSRSCLLMIPVSPACDQISTRSRTESGMPPGNSDHMSTDVCGYAGKVTTLTSNRSMSCSSRTCTVHALSFGSVSVLHFSSQTRTRLYMQKSWCTFWCTPR
jgi:hypothetical protein